MMSEINHRQRRTMTDVGRPGEQAVDPICGMMVHKQSAPGALEHEGTTYYFCSDHCLEAFRKNPQSSLPPATQLIELTRRPSEKAGEYTCPMHSAIVRDQPGSCPICGMALEPRTVSLGK